MTRSRSWTFLALFLLPLTAAAWRAPRGNAAATVAAEDSSIYVVYYWRARPGKGAEYAEYIRTVAAPIDEEARKAGVFEELTTYTPAITTGAPGADWTHMRVFRLRSFAALDGFSQGLDEAGLRVFPDPEVRRRHAEQSAGLRDLVRQEIWRKF
jgi:hypothetical protein